MYKFEFKFKRQKIIKIGKSRCGEAKECEFEFYSIKLTKMGKKVRGGIFFQIFIKIIKMNCNGK